MLIMYAKNAMNVNCKMPSKMVVENMTLEY